jgi:heme/copper-type cytochrome/quinol oxidase subunit 3
MAAHVTTPGAVEPKMWMGGIEPMKASYGKLMMWFFLISDTFTFSALLVAYGTARFSFPAIHRQSTPISPSPICTGRYQKGCTSPYHSCMASP